MKWWDKYKQEKDRRETLTRFIEVAVKEMHKSIENRRTLMDGLKSWDSISRKIAGHRIEIVKGWKLHKTWFRSGFAQLAIVGAVGCTPQEYIDTKETLRDIYRELGWDFDSCLDPKHTQVLTTLKLPFFMGLTVDGEPYNGDFKTLIEPLETYPDGSAYKSRHSGKVWEVCYKMDSGEYHMVAGEKDKNGNYREMAMSKKVLGKMERVV